jgi:hypothetical protein
MEYLLKRLFARADNEGRGARFRDIEGSIEFVS